MDYQVMPLIYAANEYFKNTTRFTIEFNDPIDKDALRYAIDKVQIRYPYFSVRLEKEGEEYVLRENSEPFMLSEGNAAICLNSPESNHHLVAFAYKDDLMSIDCSHFIADGAGVLPMFQTLAYYYIEKRYGSSDRDPSAFRLVDDEINREEYENPFPDNVMEGAAEEKYEVDKSNSYQVSDEYFGKREAYFYNLRIRQDELMAYAKANGGSPVSALGTVMYRAAMDLLDIGDKNILYQIPHNFRKALGKPLSHESLATVVFARLTPEDRNKTDEEINQLLRSQISKGANVPADLQSINGLIQLNGYLKTMPLAAKIQTMQGVVGSTMSTNTFAISYTGNFPWNGLDKYISNVYAYVGEMERENGIGLEVFVIGDYFSITMMQAGKNPLMVDGIIKAFADRGVTCALVREGTYRLCDYKLPEADQ